MRSKTHGLDPTLIRAGEFRWVWYKLIPGNVEILVFGPEQLGRSLSLRGELPSGNVYATLTGVNADFSWSIEADISFRIKPGALPDLVEHQNITSQEALRNYAAAKAGEIEAFALQWFRLHTGNPAENPAIQMELEAEISKKFPAIEDLSCVIRSARYPDMALYRSLQQVYEDYLQKQRDFLNSDLSEGAKGKLTSRLRFDELERYGQLLTKYPILLRYLALEAGAPDFAGD
ncbi:hypothetical protein AGMMS49928_21640 [Spirochaetia bacterium]|nr:hypothetical protein AGMMS49928_21640 [Spirochaetia bacterium]